MIKLAIKIIWALKMRVLRLTITPRNLKSDKINLQSVWHWIIKTKLPNQIWGEAHKLEFYCLKNNCII